MRVFHQRTNFETQLLFLHNIKVYCVQRYGWIQRFRSVVSIVFFKEAELDGGFCWSFGCFIGGKKWMEPSCGCTLNRPSCTFTHSTFHFPICNCNVNNLSHYVLSPGLVPSPGTVPLLRAKLTKQRASHLADLVLEGTEYRRVPLIGAVVHRDSCVCLETWRWQWKKKT